MYLNKAKAEKGVVQRQEKGVVDGGGHQAEDARQWSSSEEGKRMSRFTMFCDRLGLWLNADGPARTQIEPSSSRSG